MELHPWFDSTELRAVAEELGIALTAYGTGHAALLNGASEELRALAARLGRTPMQVLLRWSVQSGVGVIPRSADPAHQAENMAVFDFELSPEDMAALHALNEEHPYYWDPLPTLDTLG